MIKHHAFSARTETTRARSQRSIRRLATLALGGALTLAPLAAHGMDSPRPGPKAPSAFDGMALPPIPYKDSMPWLGWQQLGGTLKVDTLFSPVFAPSGIKLDPIPPHGDPQLPAMS